MKSVFSCIAAGSVFAALSIAQPQPRYTIVDLGTLPGGDFSQAGFVSNSGIVAGMSTVHDGTQHAVIWGGPLRMDIGAPGLNSFAFGINEKGQVLIQGESSAKDPHNENFCAYGTGLKCLAFLWQRGVMTQLPTLGGNNSTVGNINNRGEMVGIAENSTLDPACPAGVSVSGTGPQVLDFEAVIWGPKEGDIRELRPLAGDTVGMGIWINEGGQAVGASGTCANTNLPPLAFGPHAVLWEKDGSPRDLGNLGSTALNMALSINNQGDVTGTSSLTETSSPAGGIHAFLWTSQAGKMRDLGTLAGDVASVGQGINDAGDVVGTSFDAEGNPRAFLWRNGVMSDLNELVPESSPLYLLFGGGINSRGEIASFGVQKSAPHEIHAYLAIPANGKASESFSPAQSVRSVLPSSVLPEDVRKRIREGLPMGKLGSRQGR
jgi:probable HAF family extracellular repeat protein